MTWKEFKDYIDSALSKSGISEDVEIWYIDTSFPDDATLSVEVGEDGLSVS